MKNFSLPASFVEEISAMHDKLAVKVFRAVYLYMYSDGEDTSIDRIITIEGADFIYRFKAWAQKKFEQAEQRRQRAAERRRQRQLEKVAISPQVKDGELPAPQVTSHQAPQPTNQPAPDSTIDRHSRHYVPTPEEECEYSVNGHTINQMRQQIYNATADDRILNLRYDKVPMLYLLHFAHTFDSMIIKDYQERLYKHYIPS